MLSAPGMWGLQETWEYLEVVPGSSSDSLAQGMAQRESWVEDQGASGDQFILI